MKIESEAGEMWTEMENRSTATVSKVFSSEVVDSNPAEQLFLPVQQRNISTAAAACPSCTEDPLTRSSGIIPGAVAATVFIAFLLSLYAVLWKCMMSPPRRKKSKLRARVKQKTPV
ncbi:uncharacterized protein sb:cb288 [Kryptolebias marmoratus]|uniref:uncharacterized protein sb:cb288 n=1 Tax=Kryptolebias marmoratus TaxID=37003 RepID=UPI0018ACF223|nr:uncharacterized protein sb:cb288 [Kryptolebias marmoratus]